MISIRAVDEIYIPVPPGAALPSHGQEYLGVITQAGLHISWPLAASIYHQPLPLPNSSDQTHKTLVLTSQALKPGSRV